MSVFTPTITADQLAQQLEFADRLGLLKHFRDAAQTTGVPENVLLAVASRESGIGSSTLLTDWRGDYGHAHGIMQIDERWHPEFTGSHAPDDHKANILYGAGYLAGHYREFGSWSHAAAAYNAGAGNARSAIREGKHPDDRTTGGNYGKDVVYRAGIMQELAPVSITEGLPGIAILIALGAGFYFISQSS